MADTTTISGLPFPEGSDANNVPSDMADLADTLDGTIIRKLTTAGIAGLAAAEKPAGTYFHNSTTGKLEVSDGSSVTDYNSPTYAVGVRTTGTQAIGAGVTVSYTGETDPSAMLSSGTFTLPSAGLWHLSGTVYSDTQQTSLGAMVFIEHASNGVAWQTWKDYCAAVDVIVVAAASDTVKLNVVGSGNVTFARMSVVRLGAA